jgi:hypothetical protein
LLVPSFGDWIMVKSGSFRIISFSGGKQSCGRTANKKEHTSVKVLMLSLFLFYLFVATSIVLSYSLVRIL